MSGSESPEEMNFRAVYALELRKMKINNNISQHFGSNELEDEIRKVARQEMATPGRRGERIKREEISKEIVRRQKLNAQAKITRA
jgi:hypothetical protein